MTDFIDDFMIDIPRGVATRYLKQQSVPQARWQLPEDIMNSPALTYDPDNPGKKILIGAMGDKLVGIEDNRHILTVAGSRSGKSVTLVGNMLFYKGSVLALDPKAELADITAARRAALGQKVYVLDPFHYASDSIAHLRARYNPLSVLNLDSPTIIEDASLIAEAIVVQSAGNKDPHWDESAKNFIEGVILHIVTDPVFENERNLLTLRELIKSAMKPYGEDDELCSLEYAMLENAQNLQTSKATASVIAFYPRSVVTPSFWIIQPCAMCWAKVTLILPLLKVIRMASPFIYAFRQRALRLPEDGCVFLSISF